MKYFLSKTAIRVYVALALLIAGYFGFQEPGCKWAEKLGFNDDQCVESATK